MIRTPSQPTPLRWCASCDRFVRDLIDEHVEWHEGRTVLEARADINGWRFIANQVRRAA